MMSDVRELKSAPAASSAAASPYICLSTQCDMLYRIGTLPHRFSTISEQSVYTRAAEQLRFATPSPELLLSVGVGATLSDTLVSGRGEGSHVERSLPHVYMNADPPKAFPSIENLEAARRVALEREGKRAKVPERIDTLPTLQSADKEAATLALHDRLVPSGPLLAKRAYSLDYEDTRCKAPVDVPVAASCDTTTDPAVDACIKGSARAPLLPPQLVFPSVVLLRTLVQVVLTLQSSSSSSSARLSLAQYRGVQLIPWRTLLHQERQSTASSLPSLSPEAAVISVLPQVIADRVASQMRSSSVTATAPLSLEKGNMTLYALTPLTSPSSETDTRGVKRLRKGCQGDTNEESAVFSSGADVVAGAMLCERLLTTAEVLIERVAQVRYGALSADKFEEWVQQARMGDADPLSTFREASRVLEGFLYEEESAWMTDAVFHSLFSLSQNPPLEPTVDPGADVSTVEDVCSRQSTAHVKFLKISSFLYLTFLVHRSWCAHVHLTVVQALAAHKLPSKSETQAGSLGLISTGFHVTCLPPVEEALRSSQYEWRSALVYRLHEERVAGCATGDTLCSLADNQDRCEASVGGGAAVESSPSRIVLQGLTILVLNRNAQLQWWLRSSAPASCPGKGIVTTQLPHEEHQGPLNGSGTLDDLLQKLFKS